MRISQPSSSTSISATPFAPESLFEELALAHADGSFQTLLKRLAKVDVLVIDDWRLMPPKDAERRDLLEIIEDRHGAHRLVLKGPSRRKEDSAS